MRAKSVAIMGYADAEEGDKNYLAAEETAEMIAKNGYTVINGGGPGIMRAATLGAHKGGGKVIGVTYYPLERVENFEGRDEKNNFDQEVVTTNYVERTLKILEMADVYLIFKGGTGTISEFGMAWGLARIHFGRHKPLILYGDFWHEIIEAFSKNMLLRPEELKVYHIVTSPIEVLNKLKAMEVENGER